MPVLSGHRPKATVTGTDEKGRFYMHTEEMHKETLHKDEIKQPQQIE